MTAPAVAGISPKQRLFMAESNRRVNVLTGSIRAGKTIISLLRWLMFIANAPRGGELVMIGRTRDTVWRNCIAPLMDPLLFGPLALQVVGNPGAPTVRILGRVVHVLGASDAKAERAIRGMTVAGSYVDEITTLPEPFFVQLLGRMSVKGAQLFGTTNPDSPAHWLRTRFLDRLDQLGDWATWTFTLDDNPALSPEYVAAIKAEFVGLWYRRFILGEWVAAEGAVYSGWDPARHVIAADDLPRMERLIALGLDHGVTNPSAGILLGYAGGCLYAVNEWWLDGRTLPVKPTTSQQSAEVQEFLAANGTPEWVVVDPAAAAFRAQLHQDGITPAAADNDVAYGLPLIARLLGDGHLKISSACPNLIREFPGYSWDTKATEQGKDQPIKVGDHALDALRYAVVTTEQTWAHLLT